MDSKIANPLRQVTCLHFTNQWFSNGVRHALPLE